MGLAAAGRSPVHPFHILQAPCGALAVRGEKFQLIQSSSSVTPIIGHQQIADFADARVNLPFDKVRQFRDRVNGLRDSLEAKIAADPGYAIVRTLHSGSVAKGTALRTVNDFDLAVYLKPDQVPADDRLLGSWLIARLKEARPRLADDQFVPQAHCVTIAYRDGTKIDVVPVLDVGDGGADGYLIEKDTGEQVLTNVRRHLEFIRARKKRVPVHFRQVIRLAKYWIRIRKTDDADFRFKSFLAEMLCAHLLDQGVEMSDYAVALGAFFEYVVRSGLRETVVFDDYYDSSAVPVAQGVITVIDPVNPGNNVAARYTDQDRERIVHAARAALDAIDYATYVPTRERPSRRGVRCSAPGSRGSCHERELHRLREQGPGAGRQGGVRSPAVRPLLRSAQPRPDPRVSGRARGHA